MENSSPESAQPWRTRAPRPLDADLALDLVTPTLVIDLASARRNLASVLELTGGPDRWRPHLKTAKLADVMALFPEAGITRFKCATLLEAEVVAGVLSETEGADVLLAHHLHGPALSSLGDLARRHPHIRFSTLVESSAQVDAVPSEIGLFVDVDLGMHRTGAAPAAAREIASAAADRLRGLHAYDGHRHEPDAALRAERVHRGYDELVPVAAALAARCPELEVITAGTPAFPAALEFAAFNELPGVVHRVSPGTVVYHDLRSTAQLPAVPGEFAATVLTRVASLPATDRFTCDAGSKAVEAAGPELIAAALEHPAARCLGQSEEHTVFQCAAHRPSRGDLLRLVPGHVCPTVNLANRALLVEDGRPVRFVPVAARGH